MSGRPQSLCVNSFPDLAERAQAARNAYASTDDGGYPGTPAARAYHAEIDAVWAEFARRKWAILAACFGMAGAR